MKNNQKGFIIPIIIIIVAAVAMGGGMYYYSQNKTSTQVASSSTKNWKTYINKEYGFEFKYPQDWKITYEMKDSVAVAPNNYEYKEGTDGPRGLFMVGPFGNNITPELKAQRLKETLDTGWRKLEDNNFRSREIITPDKKYVIYLHERPSQPSSILDEIFNSFKITPEIIQTPQATITSSSMASITGTAKNVTSLSVSIIAKSPTPIGYKSLFGRVVPVVDGKWVLEIPEGAFTGFHGPFTIEVGTANSSGADKVLTTTTLELLVDAQPQKVSTPSVDKQTFTIVSTPDVHHRQIKIDFSVCKSGTESVSFAFGHNVFKFTGITNGKCNMQYGGEIENPGWDGSMSYSCSVPVSLGARVYQVGSGITINELQLYCSKI